MGFKERARLVWGGGEILERGDEGEFGGKGRDHVGQTKGDSRRGVGVRGPRGGAMGIWRWLQEPFVSGLTGGLGSSYMQELPWHPW